MPQSQVLTAQFKLQLSKRDKYWTITDAPKYLNFVVKGCTKLYM